MDEVEQPPHQALPSKSRVGRNELRLASGNDYVADAQLHVEQADGCDHLVSVRGDGDVARCQVACSKRARHLDRRVGAVVFPVQLDDAHRLVISGAPNRDHRYPDVAAGDLLRQVPNARQLRPIWASGLVRTCTSRARRSSALGQLPGSQRQNPGDRLRARRGPFVVSEIGGVWQTAVAVPGTAALNTGGPPGVSSLSCASAGNCSPRAAGAG